MNMDERLTECLDAALDGHRAREAGREKEASSNYRKAGELTVLFLGEHGDDMKDAFQIEKLNYWADNAAYWFRMGGREAEAKAVLNQWKVRRMIP